MALVCSKCGSKIPTSYKTPHNGTRRTKRSRKYCFNCSPIIYPSSTPSKKSERRQRKEALVKMLGGKCAKCGYNKSITALSFHHKDPQQKRFHISNGCLLKSWPKIVEEAKKCEILCLNCHAEVHSDNDQKDNT